MVVVIVIVVVGVVLVDGISVGAADSLIVGVVVIAVLVVIRVVLVSFCIAGRVYAMAIQ